MRGFLFSVVHFSVPPIDRQKDKGGEIIVITLMVDRDKDVLLELCDILTDTPCLSDCTASKPCIVCQFYDQVLDIISDEEEE